jgi:nucleoside-diphosphate kinase
MSKTLAIIKPDAVARGYTGAIIECIEKNMFTIVALQKLILTTARAQAFYLVHKDRPFYNDLVTFMTSGPVVVLVLEKGQAVQQWRDLMGATDSKMANVGTIRLMFGTSKQENAVHGSDADATALQEIGFFFPAS